MVDFDPSAAAVNLNGQGTDAFVAKYTGSGNYQWCFALGGNSNDCGSGIKCDPAGNCFVAGSVDATVDFDPSSTGMAIITNTSSHSFFAKYSNTGNYQWAHCLNGSSFDNITAITTDTSGNCFITGTFNGNMDMDFSALTSVISTTNSNSDIYLAKYNSSGAYLWAFNARCTGGGQGIALNTDRAGNCFLSGFLIGTGDFDPAANLFYLSNVGTQDVFVAKYSGAGALNWAFDVGSQFADGGYGIGNDTLGNTFVTGFFSANVDFDPGPATASLLVNGGVNGEPDFFIAKYGSCQNSPPPVSITNTNNLVICAGNTTTIQASGQSIYWYTGAVSTNAVASGTTYITPVLAAGIYTYYVEASICSAPFHRTAITLTVNALPTLTVITTNTLSCSTESVTLNASTTASTYSWSTGSTNSFIVVNPPITTSYTITVLDANSCANQMVYTQNVAHCIGIEETEKPESFVLYPNPVKAQVYLESDEIGNLELLNSVGQKILTLRVSEGKNYIDINDLAPGIYLFRFTNQTKYKIWNVIKE